MLSHFPICIYLMGFIPHKLNTDNSRCYREALISGIVERALQTIQHQASANVPSPESLQQDGPAFPTPIPYSHPLPQREYTENIQLLHGSIHA